MERLLQEVLIGQLEINQVVQRVMSTVTFLVELTLEQLIELNRLIRLQDRNGVHYDARENPYCGYIIIDKSTETGLYDPWNGGGSVFEIQLEKDVKLPIKYIRPAWTAKSPWDRPYRPPVGRVSACPWCSLIRTTNGNWGTSWKRRSAPS